MFIQNFIILHSAIIMAGCYPCIQCKKQCHNDTIQCSKCNRWVHNNCVPMSSVQLKTWAQPLLKFLCRECCFKDNEFDFLKALERYVFSIFSIVRQSNYNCDKYYLN